MLEKMVQSVLVLAEEYFKAHRSVTEWPKVPEVRDTFIFRYALCGYLSILRRIRDGGARKAKPKVLRNDVVDLSFVAFATYFDGLLTADKRAAEIYADAEYILREVFAMPRWWRRVVASLSRSLSQR
jgi:hypothetical protein